MIADFLDLVFGCTHRNTSFPITDRGAKHRSKAASVTGTYVVCLDCGKEFPYDWREMKVLGASEVGQPLSDTFADSKAA